MKVLLADDERTITVTLSDTLKSKGHTVRLAYDGLTALKFIDAEPFDSVLLDIKMPGMDGLDVLARIKDKKPDLPVVIITGYGTVETAVDALKRGAYDYVQKPFYNEEILLILERIDKYRSIKDEYKKIREEIDKSPFYMNMVGKSARMIEVYQLIENIAPSDCSVLIEGESGTGKELVADAVHNKSRRKDAALVKFSCQSVPETLIEANLFGHEKGAFTDARNQLVGRFELADKGTIFVDDIDDMPSAVQMKFLRVLQERTLERIGSTQTIKVDIRAVAATKKNLLACVKEGSFLEDLFYRLNVITIKLPPLRERIEDIPLLVEHFIRKYAKGRSYQAGTDLLEAACSYRWPGNVRELENAVSRAIVLVPPGRDGTLQKKHLMESTDTQQPVTVKGSPTLEEFLEQQEREYLQRLYLVTKGDKNEMSRILEVSRKTLWEKLKKYGIES
ncbi:MAG: sigma-54-dependent Fis family transcriptional regulator [Planctomycetes bacterium]|nr:sigma-54-dependent Fis family transcriptional regulator [Planctomycetota bacterium]